MNITQSLKNEMQIKPKGTYCPNYFKSLGLRDFNGDSYAIKEANGIRTLFTEPLPHVFKNDLIVGSIRPLFADLTDEQTDEAFKCVCKNPVRNFLTNSDHFSADYQTAVELGIPGLLQKISVSEKAHKDDPEALDYLSAMRITVEALKKRLLLYARRCEELTTDPEYDLSRLDFIAKNCAALAEDRPQTFAQGLQLVWMIHSCFLYEGRCAMALGRIDQYLYPLYKNDIETGVINENDATLLLENAFAKICEQRYYFGFDETINICIGGIDCDGKNAVNGLSYCVLNAVKNVNMPGPNLSARISENTPDEFLDACLKVIGTGLGYPALMNDAVNMAALRKYGYEEADVKNYSMVGCIENFMTGCQPPWSDGRFDTPRFLEYIFFEGEGYDPSRKGIKTRPLKEITTMQQFMQDLEKQIAHGVKEYVDEFYARNVLPDPERYPSPFLSCFCKDCIARARDINMGGSKYPSVHGAALMGVGTVADSLAAIERVVFDDRAATLEDVAQAMKDNFDGHGELKRLLLSAPKYGNNDDYADKYAVWFTEYLAKCFSQYKTYDGGGIYVAMAANISNIYAGKLIGATPDGRLKEQPLSDAASPTYGRDTRGATSTLLSVSKPDYTQCACGTVVNQKYSPTMFTDEKRELLLRLIRVYFNRGGQEIQINATSAEVLRDAMAHPENYPTLVVRVSGFSALYVTLDKEVQEDILHRTQQD